MCADPSDGPHTRGGGGEGAPGAGASLRELTTTRELCRREESVLAVTARQRVSLYTNTFDTDNAQAAYKSATAVTRKAAIQGNE